MAESRPSEKDHEVFLNRALADPAEKLPEETVKDIDAKIKAEEAVSEDLKDTIDADMLNDGSSGSRIKTYVGDGNRKKILQQSEYQVDKEVSKKKTRIDDDVARLKDKKKSIIDQMNAAESAVKETVKELSNASISVEREAVSAAGYWKALANLRRNKKGGRKAGTGYSKTKKSKKSGGGKGPAATDSSS